MSRWYDLESRIDERGTDQRSKEDVAEETLALMEESVRLRFRSDVPVGVCLSGGLDSSLLFGIANQVSGSSDSLKCFTFECGDPVYDETPWVDAMVAHTGAESVRCRLEFEDVSRLADEVSRFQDEPFGGIPTLAMVNLHRTAKKHGVTVLLDGNGLDEAWCGYDYYQNAAGAIKSAGNLQGSTSRSTRSECLDKEFRDSAPELEAPSEGRAPLLSLQIRDLLHTKIPRAMRFADRASMEEGRELREPFLDHRLVELGVAQRESHKIRDGQGKWLLRYASPRIVPRALSHAPKRPVQTPQREWLRGPLGDWADEQIRVGFEGMGSGWFDVTAALREWKSYRTGQHDNSFWVWQWINLGLLSQHRGK